MPNELEPPVTIAAPGRIALHSALTFQTARRVCEAGEASFVRDGSAALVVDCSGVTQSDSAGLAVLIEWRHWARRRGLHVKYINLPGQISAIAHLSEVSDLLLDPAA